MEHDPNERRLTDQVFGQLDQPIQDDLNFNHYDELDMARIQELNQNDDNLSNAHGDDLISGNPALLLTMMTQQNEARLTNQSFGHSDNQHMEDPNSTVYEQVDMARNPIATLNDTLTRHQLTMIPQQRLISDEEIDNYLTNRLNPIEPEINLEPQVVIDIDEGFVDEVDGHPLIDVDLQDISRFCNYLEDERVLDSRDFVEFVLTRRAIYGYRDFLAFIESEVRATPGMVREEQNRFIFFNFFGGFNNVELTLLTNPNRLEHELPIISYRLDIDDEEYFLIQYATFIHSTFEQTQRELFMRFCDALFEPANIRDLNLNLVADVRNEHTLFYTRDEPLNDQPGFNFDDDNNDDYDDNPSDEPGNDFSMYVIFRNNRYLNESREARRRFFSPQGDMNPTDTAEAGSSVQTEDSIGVALVENRGDTHAIPAETTRNPTSTIPYGMEPATFPDLTSRWNNFKVFPWTTADTNNKILLEIKVPIDVVLALITNPAMLPCLQYNYYRPNLTFRFQPNTTNFHQGRLIVAQMSYPRSEYNEAGSRTLIDARQLVQLDFATINASGSNVVEVEVPFKSFLDMIPIRNGAVGSSQYFCSLYIGVLSPLRIGEGGSQSISVAVQVKFECNGEPTYFFGQQTQQFLQAQGLFNLAENLTKMTPFGSIINRVEGLLGGLGAMYKPTKNCDRPVDPTEAQPVVQYMVPALSWGDGPSVGRVMRLKPNCLTPFEPTIVTTTHDELTNESIIRKWGYIGSFTVTTDQQPGTILQTIPITPMDYTTVGSNILPTPLGGVSSMFTYWSGGIEYKFIVVKANPQSLRLRFSSNPGNVITDTNRERIVDLHSTVVDFQELTEATYVAPYMGPTKMLSVLHNGVRLTAGFVQVRLETSLVSIPTCAMSVEILVYQRAASGLELSIPRSTIFEPDIDRPSPPTTNTVTITKPVGMILYAWVFEPRTVVNQTESPISLTNGIEPSVSFTWNTNQVVLFMGTSDLNYGPGQCNYRLPKTAPGDIGRIFVVKDPRFQAGGVNYNFTAKTAGNVDISYTVIANDPTFEFENSRRFPFQYTNIQYPAIEAGLPATMVFVPDSKFYQPQGTEEREAVAGSLIGEERTKQVGEILLGEKFDLRTCLRRYQLFAEIDFIAQSTGFHTLTWDVNAGPYHVGSPLRRVSNITWMHDCFRFFRGSMNYQLIPIYQTNPNQKFMITHIPAGVDQAINFDPTFILDSTDPIEISMYAHEFPTDGTRTIPVIVPHYNPGNILVNGSNTDQFRFPKIASTFSFRNGSIQTRAWFTTGDRLVLRIERALADDSSFQIFQGFPLCAPIPALADYTEVTSSNPLEPTTPFFQPQGSFYERPKPRYPISGLIVAMQQEKRRGQKAIRKFFRSLAADPSFMTPQSDEILTMSKDQFNEAIELSICAEGCYREGHRFTREMIPQFLLNDNPELTETAEILFQDFMADEKHFVKTYVIDFMIAASTKYSNFPTYFFDRLKITRPGDGLLTKIKNTVLNTTATIPTMITTQLTERISSGLGISMDMFTALKATLDAMCKATSANIFFLLSQVQMIWKSTEIWVKGFAICNLLANFGLLDTRHLGLAFIVVELLYLGGGSTLAKQYHYHYEAQGEFETPKCVIEWTAALIGGVAATAGLASAPTWSKGISAFARDLSTTTNSWYLVLTRSGTFITDYLLYLFGCEAPQAVALAELRRTGADVESWAQKVLAITRPETRDMVLGSPLKRQEVCALYQEGAIFLRAILTNKDRPEQVSSFLTIWRELSDLFKHTGEVPNSIEANTQPICIWLSGSPGIGKSACAKELALSIAKIMDIHYDGDPFFVRQCNRKYWDGWHGQPIVIIDDALQIRSAEADSAFLEDYYGLLTEAAYLPEFAKTEEKTKIVTPKILIICSNQTFPGVPVIGSIKSFYRRRDIMLHVELAEHIRALQITHCADMKMTKAMFTDNNHLVFSQYLDPSSTDSPLGPKMQFYAMISALKPRLDHLVETRRQHAIGILEQSNQLHPEAITRSREELMERLASLNTIQELVGSVTAGLSQAQGLDEEAHRPEKPTEFSVIEESLCMHGCSESKSIQCFCAYQLESARTDKSFRYCTNSGMYCVSNGLNYSQLGECTDCLQSARDEAHDCIRAIILQDAEHELIAELVTLPPPRRQLTRLEKPGPIAGLKRLALWFKIKSKSIWEALPWKYIFPIVLSLGVAYICQAFSLIDKAKDYFNLSESSARKTIDVDLESKPIPQMASSGSVRTASGGKAPVLKHLVATPQDNTDTLIQRIQRNKVKVTARFGDGKMRKSMGLGICDRYIIFPHHIFSEHSSDLRGIGVTLCGPHNTDAYVELKREDIEVTRINNLDLCLVKLLNRVIPQFKDLRKSVVKSKDLSRVSRRCLLLDYGDYNANRTNVETVHVDPVTMPIRYQIDSKILEYNLIGYGYSIERSGMCGSILIDPKTNLIIGFHTTGDPGKAGYSTMIVRDHFAELQLSCEGMEEPELEAGGSVQPRGEFIPIGKLVDAQCVTLPMKSQLARSICFGVVAEPVRVPVKLATAGELKPGLTNLTLAVEKGGDPTLNFDLARIEEVADHLTQEIVAACKPTCSGIGRRSVEEAIVGRVGVPFQEALKRNTSVGWPLSTLGCGTKKDHFIDYLETSDGLRVKGLHPELARLYDVNHTKRKQGIIPFSPYQNFLKDERLKPGKKPRLINGCPLDQVIEFRRYIMDFISALQSNGMDVGIGVGMNVHGMDWSRLTNKLLSKGTNIMSGDYSGFGPGLNTEFVMRVCELINAWYRKYQTERRDQLEEDEQVRRTLFENLAFSHEVNMDTLLLTICGSPSGNPGTAPINSIVARMYIYYMWLEVFKGTVLGSLRAMTLLIFFCVYGDDIVMSIPDTIKDRWNNEILQFTFARFGIKYTDADKSGQIRKYTSIEEATFLKCHFRKHPVRGEGVWLAALEKPMIEDIPNWIRKSNLDWELASLANCIESARLSYAWGFEYFDDMCRKFRNYWAQKGRNFDIETWSYLDSLFFGELEGIDSPIISSDTNYAWA